MVILKFMKKINIQAIMFCALIFVRQQSQAQSDDATVRPGNKIVYSAGVIGAISTGKFSNTHQWGLGGNIQADIPIAQDLYGIIDAGFVNFFGREVTKNSTRHNISDAQLVPVKLGAKYVVLGVFYIQGEAGVSFALNKKKLNYERSAAFVYAPQIGIRLPLTAENSLDIGVLYERSTEFKNAFKDSKINFFALKVSYPFTF
jgi:hypothetical protein